MALGSPLSFGFTSARVGSSSSHAAAADIAVLDVLSDPPPDTSDFYDLASGPLCLPGQSAKLVVSGYPKPINEIQYPDEDRDGKLKPRRHIASGFFAGEGTAPMLGAIGLDAPDTLVSYNGMSGSPVFLVRTAGLQTFASLAGLAVREMTSSGTIDFVPAPLLRRVLDS